jgi:hypothetical protein
MPFDVKKFKRMRFVPRTETIKVPALQAFFDADEKPVFVVRGLTGEEMARVNLAAQKQNTLMTVAEALLGSDKGNQIDALRQALGISGDLPEDLARRIEMLAMGLQEPAIDVQTAVKLFEVAPVICYEMTNKILLLSGQGQQQGELKGSGDSPTSEPAPIMPTTTDGSSTT